jgi:sulfate transport system substrate-binding protein
LGLDVQKIQKEGLIEPGWETATPQRGIITRSVVALTVRPGNPKGIKDWADLTRDGVKWITADPKSSGAARWNFVALWNSIVASSGDEEKAKKFITRAFRNVPILPRDAREATDAFFKQGQADALINYENEVLLAIKKGQQAEYTIPLTNVAIDHPAAIVDKNVAKHGNRQVVEAFLKFLYSPAAQEEFARVGFRPVDDTLSRNPELAKKYPPVKNLASIQDYGGWPKAQKKFFADGALFDKIREN